MYWENVSFDTEKENDAKKLSMARVATAKYWPIIAQAKSESGLADVCDLISEGVVNAITPIAESPAEIAVLSSKILDSYVEDWNLYQDSIRTASIGAPTKETPASKMTCPTCSSQDVGQFASMHKNAEGVAPFNAPYDCRNCGASWKLSGPASVGHFNPVSANKTIAKCPKCGSKIDWPVKSGEKITCKNCGHQGGANLSKEKTALIEDAHSESQKMQSQWGLPSDLSDDTAKQLQSEVNSAESEDRASRVNRGNGIGVADESSGNYVEGPGKNQGEDPVLHGDGNSHMDNHTASFHFSLMDNFGTLHEANQYIKGSGSNWVITQKGTGKTLSHHTSKEEAQKAFEAMEAHKHGFIVIADDDDQVDENEDMQSEGKSVNNTERDIRTAAIQRAQEMVDAMPKEASVEAVKKEMLRRALSLKLNSEETDLVVSAAVTHAHARGRRPLDNVEKEGRAPGKGDNMLMQCPICGAEIPASEFKNHMKNKHPHDAPNHIALLKEEVRTDTHNSVYLHYPTSSEDGKYSVGCHSCGEGHKVKTVSIHENEDDARSAFKKHYQMHDSQKNQKTAVDNFSPTSDNTSENEDQGGTNSDDMTGSDPGGESTPSNLQGEQVGGSGASADIADEENGTSTVAKTSPPRTKPSHNPNAVTKPAPTPPIVALPSAGTTPGIPAPSPMNPMTSPQMQANLHIADKLVEITEGILSTNPGMQRQAAISIANKTLAQFPAILHKEAWGGADWLPHTDPDSYPICPQCQHKGLDKRINRCHFCGFVDLSGHEPDPNDSSWDPISGKSTIRPGSKTFKNPGGN